MSVVLEYIEKNQQLKRLKKEVAELKDSLDMEYFSIVVTKRLDTAKLKKEKPEVYNKYIKEVESFKINI